MTKYKYSYQGSEEGIAKAALRDLPISSKHAIEICNRLRNKTVEFAKSYLEEVIAGKRAVPYTRFTAGAGHKTAIGPGKFPEKASKELLKAIELVETIAINNGLSKDLKIIHFMAQRASAPWHYGRQKRRKMKRTTIEIVVSEFKKKPVKKVTKTKPVEKKEVKETAKPVEVKSQPKQEEKPKPEVKESNSKSQEKTEIKEEKVEDKK